MADAAMLLICIRPEYWQTGLTLLKSFCHSFEATAGTLIRISTQILVSSSFVIFTPLSDPQT